MVSKINKNDSDSDSESEVENDYSGFNLIPDYKDESDTDSVYSDINNGYEIKYNDKNEYYTRNNNENDSNTTTITNNNNNNIADDSEDEGDLKYIEDNNNSDNNNNNNINENGMDSFGDFEQFHSTENENENENDVESKLRSNPMFRNMDFSEYFPKVPNDPFNEDSNDENNNQDNINNNDNNNNNNNNNNNIYSKSNEKGHMVLEKDKLFPPEHVQLIQDCMKNIKLDYKPHWANKVTEDKWMGVLKDKINNNK
ncbi:hypothetical protein ACTA71_000897 [Dictyostelium dimigraforme]